MYESEKKINYTNWVFACLILLIVIAVITIGQIGKKQEFTFLEDFQKYNYAIQLLEQDQANQAIIIFEELITTYTNYPYLLWNYGISLAMIGEFENSIDVYQKALKQRPFLIKNSVFTQSLGEVYFNYKDFEKAKVYLEYCLNLEITSEQEQKIQKILQEIEKK